MTEEEQDLIIGRAHRNHAEAKSLLAAVKTRCDEIAEIASGLAKGLRSPTHVTVVKPGDSGVVFNSTADHFMFTPAAAKLLTPDYIREQVELYRSTKQRKIAARQTLIDLGQPDPGE